MIRAWRVLASWAIPVVMGIAYSVLAWSSETDTTGKAWMALGFGFVLVVWWVFRTLVSAAGLSRAVAVGDTERVLELTTDELARKKPARARTPLLIYRALALELRGEWAQALTTLGYARTETLPPADRPTWELLAGVGRVGALVELGDPAGAREIFASVIAPNAERVGQTPYAPAAILVTLAEARVRWAEGDLGGAEPLFVRVTDNIRAGSAARAVAHFYAARIADSRDDRRGAARHREAAAKLAPRTWVDPATSRERPASAPV